MPLAQIISKNNHCMCYVHLRLFQFKVWQLAIGVRSDIFDTQSWSSFLNNFLVMYEQTNENLFEKK